MACHYPFVYANMRYCGLSSLVFVIECYKCRWKMKSFVFVFRISAASRRAAYYEINSYLSVTRNIRKKLGRASSRISIYLQIRVHWRDIRATSSALAATTLPYLRSATRLHKMKLSSFVAHCWTIPHPSSITNWSHFPNVYVYVYRTPIAYVIW